MLEKSQRKAIIRIILKDVEEDLRDEEIVHQVLEKTLSEDTELEENQSFGDRAADKLASFAGSWTFIGLFVLLMGGWMVVNLAWLANPFDPFPFILLNLVLSCISAIQAPLIMMSQNRQEKKDRLRNENDYKVNLKTEFIIHDLHFKLDHLLENQHEITQALQALNPQREMDQTEDTRE